MKLDAPELELEELDELELLELEELELDDELELLLELDELLLELEELLLELDEAEPSSGFPQADNKTNKELVSAIRARYMKVIFSVVIVLPSDNKWAKLLILAQQPAQLKDDTLIRQTKHVLELGQNSHTIYLGVYKCVILITLKRMKSSIPKFMNHSAHQFHQQNQDA